jgi:hypothetical protein
MAVSDNPQELTQEETQVIFSNYFKESISYNASDVSAVVGYFLKRGFDKVSAVNTAAIFLQQAQIDKVPVYVLLDTLKGLKEIELTDVVSQILNLYRKKTSTLGYKTSAETALFDERNVVY